MRVERRIQEPWRPPGQQNKNESERVPLCPVCQSQGLELRKEMSPNYLCISCNHTWGT